MIPLPGSGDNIWWDIFAPQYAPQASETFRAYVADAVAAPGEIALARLARAIAAAQAGGDSAAEATALFYRGAHFLALGAAGQAEEAFAASAQLWPTLGTGDLYTMNHAATLEGLARSQVGQNAFGQALGTRIAANDMLAATAIHALRAEVVRGMADLHFIFLGYDLAAAAPIYQEARQLYRQATDVARSHALTLRRMALVALLGNEGGRATPLLAESIRLYHDLNDAAGEAGALALLALARLGLDGSEVARGPAGAAIEMARAAGDAGAKALGWALLVRARIAQAQPDLDEAAALFTAKNDPLGLAQVRVVQAELRL